MNYCMSAGMVSVAAVCASVLSISQAQTPAYHIAGISCVPSSQTIKAETYVSQAGNIRFDIGKTGRLTMFCPITPEQSFRGALKSLTTLLRDDDGRGSGLVAVNLRRLQRSDGAISDHPGAQLNSNRDCRDSDVTGWKECVVRFETGLDFSRFYYFFQVTLERTDARKNVYLGGIRLQGAPT